MTVGGYKELSAERATVEVTKSPMEFADLSELPANHHTDHIVEVDWDSSAGWGDPSVHPWAPLQLDPTAAVFHYAVTCFEGMKAYKSVDGKTVRLFRPECNMERLNNSAARLCLPQINADAAIKLIEKLLQLDERFIAPGHYVYLRPTLMGTEASLGFKTPAKAKFLVMATLFPVMNDQALKLWCSPPTAIRAWPGGFGHTKLGANYGPTLEANNECVRSGYNQVLWLLGDRGVVTEAGTSNFFVAWKNKLGKVEILTCPLTTGVILPGVTRRSVLETLRQKYPADEVDVVEREFTVSEIEDAAADGRLIEAFSCGTAYFVAPVETIRTPSGKEIAVPTEAKYAASVKDALSNIMWGKVDHPWGHVVPPLQK